MLRQSRITLSSLLLLASAMIPVQAAEQDTLDIVLERIRVQETRHFKYRETRNMALLAKPWQATGDMYTSPQQMVIAQQTPTPVYTVISVDRMQHIDTAQDINRSLKLEQPFAVPGMEPFMLLLYGATGLSELEQDYVLGFDSTDLLWSLYLAPRQHSEGRIIRMQLSGGSGHGPDQLVLEYADGDRTEWQLSLMSQGEAAGRELQRLLVSIHQSP